MNPTPFLCRNYIFVLIVLARHKPNSIHKRFLLHNSRSIFLSASNHFKTTSCTTLNQLDQNLTRNYNLNSSNSLKQTLHTSNLDHCVYLTKTDTRLAIDKVGLVFYQKTKIYIIGFLRLATLTTSLFIPQQFP